MHGIKILSYSLPNGLTGATCGPCSHRQNDNRVVAWSGIDAWLCAFQLGMACLAGMVYAFYCDNGFGSVWDCLHTKHRAPIMRELSARQQAENKVMKKVQVSIEWSYGSVKTNWKMCNHWDLFHIDKDPAIVYSQIRVMHLLQNCITCIQGNHILGSHVFHCCPPILEDYLLAL